MIGGTVIEVCEIKAKPDRLWVNCVDYPCGQRQQACSVLVERNPDSEQIQIGDRLWWQSGKVFWTALDESRIEVEIRKIGGSGVTYQSACETT
jgi:hypothetical protein